MLRVGLVLGGTIIDEILIRERETVTLGQSVHNHLCVPVDGIPKSLPLFEVVDGRYQLRVIGAMDGRLSSGGKVQTLEQLKQQSARNEKDEWVLPLSDSARGKLSLGPMTLLFQFVSARPVPPKPKLPASVRQSLVNRVEPRLALILAGSVFVHFAVGTWAYTRDQILHRPVERIAHTFQVGQYEPPLIEAPEPELALEPSDAPAATTVEKDIITTVRKSESPQAKRTDAKVAVKDVGGSEEIGVDEIVAQTAMIAALTGGPNGEGLFSEMSKSNQGADLDSSIDANKGRRTVTLGPPKDRHRDLTASKIGVGHKTNIDAPKDTENVKEKQEDNLSLVAIRPPEQDGVSTLSPDSVIKTIRARYLKGIKLCHHRALKVDPTVSGRVSISMTIGPTGKVTRAQVKGFDATVDTCISKLAARWRFASPKEGGKATSESYVVPLLLKPSS